MTPLLTIRPARDVDADAIAALIGSLAHCFLNEAAQEEAAGFLASLAAPALRACIADPAFHYVAAFLDGELVGVAALRDKRHVHHLFVSPAHQRCGLAARLWQHLRREAERQGHDGGYTVNSSLYAVPVYRRWGFVPEGPPQTTRGVSFQPMRLAAAPAHATAPA